MNDLLRVFIRCKQYELSMNPLKCAFRVSFEKFFGYIVDRKGIDLDIAKTKTIQGMEPLMICKQLEELYKEGVLSSQVHSFLG